MFSGETGDKLPKNEAPNNTQKLENEPSASNYYPPITVNETINEEGDDHDANTDHGDNIELDENKDHDDNTDHDDGTDCEEISDQDSNQAECNTSNSLSDSDGESCKADHFDSTDQENDEPDYVKFCDYRLAIIARREALNRAFEELGLDCNCCLGSAYARAYSMVAQATRNVDAVSGATSSTDMDSVKETIDAIYSNVDQNNERPIEKKIEIPSCSTDENKINNEVNEDMKKTSNADQDTLLASGGDESTIQFEK